MRIFRCLLLLFGIAALLGADCGITQAAWSITP